jgi:hypothetical protein
VDPNLGGIDSVLGWVFHWVSWAGPAVGAMIAAGMAAFVIGRIMSLMGDEGGGMTSGAMSMYGPAEGRANEQAGMMSDSSYGRYEGGSVTGERGQVERGFRGGPGTHGFGQLPGNPGNEAIAAYNNEHLAQGHSEDV